MAADESDNITVRFSVLQSLSMSDLEDSLDMWAQIADAMSWIEEEPAARAESDNQAAHLIQHNQQLAEILDNEMTHREQAGWRGQYYTWLPAKTCYLHGHNEGVLHHLHPKNIKKRWSYNQDQWKETILRMLVCMWLPTNFKKMWEPKISKLKVGYSSSARLIFQSWLKDICFHVEEIATDAERSQPTCEELYSQKSLRWGGVLHGHGGWGRSVLWRPDQSPLWYILVWWCFKLAHQWFLWPVSKDQRAIRHLCWWSAGAGQKDHSAKFRKFIQERGQPTAEGPLHA